MFFAEIKNFAIDMRRKIFCQYGGAPAYSTRKVCIFCINYCFSIRGYVLRYKWHFSSCIFCTISEHHPVFLWVTLKVQLARQVPLFLTVIYTECDISVIKSLPYLKRSKFKILSRYKGLQEAYLKISLTSTGCHLKKSVILKQFFRCWFY